MNEREEVCKNNFLRVRKRLSGSVDESDRQFFATSLREIWSSFEGYLSWKFPEKSPRKMRKSFSGIYQKLFESWIMSDYFKKSLEKLYELCPVEDMRPIDPEPPKELEDKTDLFEILDVNYRIRSNLDHGSKELESETEIGTRNRELVECALRTTYEILEKVLLNEKIIRN